MLSTYTICSAAQLSRRPAQKQQRGGNNYGQERTEDTDGIKLTEVKAKVTSNENVCAMTAHDARSYQSHEKQSETANNFVVLGSDVEYTWDPDLKQLLAST